MTAPLKQLDGSTSIGKRIRDCETNEVFTILGVDGDGHYILYYEGNLAIWCLQIEVHREGGSHLCTCDMMNQDMVCLDCAAGKCWDCYTWIKESQ